MTLEEKIDSFWTRSPKYRTKKYLREHVLRIIKEESPRLRLDELKHLFVGYEDLMYKYDNGTIVDVSERIDSLRSEIGERVIPVITEPSFTEGVLINIKRPDGTVRATTQDGYIQDCDHDNYTEEEGENWVVCDTCLRLGNIVDDISDDGWDGEKRQYTVTKTIEWS